MDTVNRMLPREEDEEQVKSTPVSKGALLGASAFTLGKALQLAKKPPAKNGPGTIAQLLSSAVLGTLVGATGGHWYMSKTSSNKDRYMNNELLKACEMAKTASMPKVAAGGGNVKEALQNLATKATDLANKKSYEFAPGELPANANLYSKDALGNFTIPGVTIPEYNKILDTDSLTVRQAKQIAQLRQQPDSVVDTINDTLKTKVEVPPNSINVAPAQPEVTIDNAPTGEFDGDNGLDTAYTPETSFMDEHPVLTGLGALAGAGALAYGGKKVYDMYKERNMQQNTIPKVASLEDYTDDALTGLRNLGLDTTNVLGKAYLTGKNFVDNIGASDTEATINNGLTSAAKQGLDAVTGAGKLINKGMNAAGLGAGMAHMPYSLQALGAPDVDPALIGAGVVGTGAIGAGLAGKAAYNKLKKTANVKETNSNMNNYLYNACQLAKTAADMTVPMNSAKPAPENGTTPVAAMTTGSVYEDPSKAAQLAKAKQVAAAAAMAAAPAVAPAVAQPQKTAADLSDIYLDNGNAITRGLSTLGQTVAPHLMNAQGYVAEGLDTVGGKLNNIVVGSGDVIRNAGNYLANNPVTVSPVTLGAATVGAGALGAAGLGAAGVKGVQALQKKAGLEMIANPIANGLAYASDAAGNLYNNYGAGLVGQGVLGVQEGLNNAANFVANNPNAVGGAVIAAPVIAGSAVGGYAMGRKKTASAIYDRAMGDIAAAEALYNDCVQKIAYAQELYSDCVNYFNGDCTVKTASVVTPAVAQEAMGAAQALYADALNKVAAAQTLYADASARASYATKLAADLQPAVQELAQTGVGSPAVGPDGRVLAVRPGVAPNMLPAAVAPGAPMPAGVACTPGAPCAPCEEGKC